MKLHLSAIAYQMIEEGIEYNAQNWTAPVNEPKGDTDIWKAVNEVGGSVCPKNIGRFENNKKCRSNQLGPRRKSVHPLRVGGSPLRMILLRYCAEGT